MRGPAYSSHLALTVLTVMPLDDADAGIEGRSWAYVSVIDELTNDPINLW